MSCFYGEDISLTRPPEVVQGHDLSIELDQASKSLLDQDSFIQDLCDEEYILIYHIELNALNSIIN